CFVSRWLLPFALAALSGAVISLAGCGGGAGGQTKSRPGATRNAKVLRVTLPHQPGAVYLVFGGPTRAIQFVEQAIRTSSKKAHYAVAQMPQGPTVCAVHDSPVSMTIYSSNKRAVSSFCYGARKGLSGHG